ncbi:MAG: GNAT family N-acetyltransferase [Athalassotoga sp.]
MRVNKSLNIKRLEPSRLLKAVELADRVFKPKDGSMGTNFPVLFSKKNAHNILVIEEGNKIVSMVGMYYAYAQIFTSRIKVVFIGAVCTDEKYRGKGYATALTYEAAQIALKNDVTLMMIHGDNDIYRNFGAVDAGTYFTIEIKPMQKLHSHKLKIATDSDIKKMAIWHSKEPVRFIRTFANFKIFHKVGHTWDNHVKTFIGDQAYITVVEISGTYNCIEFAGEPNEVAMLIQNFANEHGKLTVHLNLGNKDCISRLLMEVPQRRQFYGTMRVLDKFKFLDQLKDYLDESISGTDKGMLKVKLSNFDDSDFTKIVFGSTEGSPQFTHEIFPIPLPDYHGMDYI